jgi:putative phosphoserine phosphatase / 1-acylglycerol-3-phosphate O-acyltransferase
VNVDGLVAEIEEGGSGPDVAAFFDFDGTLIYGYSGLVAARQRAQSREMTPGEALRTLTKSIEMGLGRTTYAELLGVLAETWKGRTDEDLLEWGERLFRAGLAHRVYPEARRLIAAHRRRGHTVVIATSATRYQVVPLARDLDIDDVLCTTLTTVDGVLTGEVARPDLWGAGKATAVEKFAADRGIQLERSFAYADGSEDIELLKLVGNPRAINPGRSLTAAAGERGWPICRFSGRGRPGPEQLARNLAAVGGLVAGMSVGLGVGLLNRRKRDATNIGISMGSDLMLGLLSIRVNVVGEEHLFSQRPAVFILNHQSILDGPVAMSLVRHDFTGVGKAELARNPVGKAFAALTDVVLIDRSSTKDAIAALEPLLQEVKNKGLSILIAPEGTRSPTARLGPFKKGAFRIAMSAGLPIVPIVIRNTHDLGPKGGGLWHSGTVDVAVLPPISVADWTVADLSGRIADVRQQYLDTLANWPGE